MNKRGQIFLIAALVIVLIVAGFGVYNSVKVPTEDKKVYDLSKEIKYEGSQIIDSGVYSNNNSAIVQRLNETIDYYATSNPDSEIVLIYGNETAIREGKAQDIFYTFNDTGSIGMVGSNINEDQRVVGQANVSVNGNIVEVMLPKNELFDFNITEGQNFYLIVKTSKQEGQFVVSK